MTKGLEEGLKGQNTIGSKTLPMGGIEADDGAQQGH
jgi:hypothetical protein